MRVRVFQQSFPGQFKHIEQEWAKSPGWGETLYVEGRIPGCQPLSGCL